MIDIDPDDLVACICEGSSEMTIMGILLDHNLLCFSKSQLLSQKVLSPVYYRKKDVFQSEFLSLDYGSKKIVVLVVQDRALAYKIQSPYNEKIKKIYSLITKPELEMLMVHSLGLDNEYGKCRNCKPSIFLQNHLKIKSSKLKSKDYINEFYQGHSLWEAIIKHKQITREVNGHHFLADILK